MSLDDLAGLAQISHAGADMLLVLGPLAVATAARFFRARRRGRHNHSTYRGRHSHSHSAHRAHDSRHVGHHRRHRR